MARDEYDFVVLGAGMAGLAFAFEVSEKGYSVLVLERDGEVGGLSRTLDYKGYRFDYCAHRFHSANAKVMNRVKGLMGGRFRAHRQRSRILMFGRFLKYPFELQNLLRAMPLRDAVLCGFDFIGSAIRRKLLGVPAQLSDYRAWFAYYFGDRLYRVMCAPYTTKIWKTKPEYLASDWADQRFQGVNLRKLIVRTLGKLLRLDFSSYSIDDETLAPDGGEFWYPPTGIQEIPEHYAERIRKNGGDVLVSAPAAGVDTETREVTYRSGAETKKIKYGRAVISTIPLHNLCAALGSKNAQVEADLAALKYMNIIFVYLMLDKERVSLDHWLYFPDSEIPFNRSVEFKNWSEMMAPKGKTAVCLDITCYEGDELWAMPKDALTRKCVEGAERAGLIKASEVCDSLVIKIRDAYPFYDLDYRRKVETIVRHCEKSGTLFCLGRTGIFQYNNSDGSIEMAMELAQRLGAPEWQPGDVSASLLGYKFKDISY